MTKAWVLVERILVVRAINTARTAAQSMNGRANRENEQLAEALTQALEAADAYPQEEGE